VVLCCQRERERILRRELRSWGFTAIFVWNIGSIWSKVRDRDTFWNIKRYDATLRVRAENLISKKFIRFDYLCKELLVG
jgi:hypothetical protein